MCFLHLCDSAEAAAGRPARFLGRQSALHTVPFRQLQVGENFVFQLPVQLSLAQQGQQAIGEAADSHDDASRNRATRAVAFSHWATSTASCFRPALVSE